LSIGAAAVDKSTSLDEATFSSEEIKPIAFAVIELYLSEGISWPVENLLNKYKEKFVILQSIGII